jgi:hypothetical protein
MTGKEQIWSFGCLAKFIKHRATGIGQLTFAVTIDYAENRKDNPTEHGLSECSPPRRCGTTPVGFSELVSR